MTAWTGSSIRPALVARSGLDASPSIMTRSHGSYRRWRGRVLGVYVRGWDGRSRLAALEEDFIVLGTRPHRSPAHPPSFTREPEIWGALYALEGSRLGNRIILLRGTECGSKDERLATHFLAQGLEDRTAWDEFVAQLDRLHYDGETFESAVLGAERVFETYLNSAERCSG